VADASDEIAYLNHDLDDALRAGILDFEMLHELPLLGDLARRIQNRPAEVSQEVCRTRVVSSMIDLLVTDLISRTRALIEEEEIDSPQAVRERTEQLVGFSPAVEQARKEVKRFLFDRFYNHPKVLSRTEGAERVVGALFELFAGSPERLPEAVQGRFDETGKERAITDYVAGMTDRFAVSEHARLTGSPAPIRSL
jgi:dGTPase